MSGRFTTSVSQGPAAAGIVLASSIGIAALGSSIGLPELPDPLSHLAQRLPGIFTVHMAASGMALILLPWTLLLRRRSWLHRVLGRICAALLLVGGVTSLPSALQSEAVPLARLGFFVQGLLCLVFLIGAVQAVRAGNIDRHAQFMWRVSALVFGAIVLRFLMAVSMRLGCQQLLDLSGFCST